MCRFTLPCITWVCVHSDTAAEASHVVSLKIYGYTEYHQRIHCIHIKHVTDLWLCTSHICHQILRSVHKKLFKGGQQHNLMACPSSGRHHLWFQHDHCDNNIQTHIDYTTTTIYITSFIDSDVIKS